MSAPSFLYPGEIEVAVFPFADRLEAGETIASAEMVAVAAFGTDATPEALLTGSPSISGTDVLHRIVGTVPGVIYHVYAKATGSTGLLHFSMLTLKCQPL